VGPSLAGVAQRAAARVAEAGYRGDARTAADYLRESILNPSVYLVPGALYGTPQGVSLMPGGYATVLSTEQVDDLVAYLRTLQ
jgi:nitric oxide reductase subunit C